MSDVAEISKNYILYFLIPMWIVPGLADYFCHRRTNIETTSGLREAVVLPNPSVDYERNEISVSFSASNAQRLAGLPYNRKLPKATARDHHF